MLRYCQYTTQLPWWLSGTRLPKNRPPESTARQYHPQDKVPPMIPQLTSCEWSGRAAGPLGRHQRWLHRPGSASPPSLSVLCWQARVRERKETQKSIYLHSFQQSRPKLRKGDQKKLVWVESVFSEIKSEAKTHDTPKKLLLFLANIPSFQYLLYAYHVPDIHCAKL